MNLDVNRLLDERNWSTYQKFLIACVALTIILDGIDNSMLGTAIPDLMREWGRPSGVYAAPADGICRKSRAIAMVGLSALQLPIVVVAPRPDGAILERITDNCEKMPFAGAVTVASQEMSALAVNARPVRCSYSPKRRRCPCRSGHA